MKHHIKSSILEVAKITGLDPRIEIEKILTYLTEHELEELDLVYRKWVDDRISQFEEAITFVGQFDNLAELEAVPKEDLEDGAYAYVGSGNNFAVFYYDAISETWYSSVILPANIIQALLEANNPSAENPFATMADVDGGGGGSGLPQDLKDALEEAENPNGSNPFITLSFLTSVLSTYNFPTGARLIEVDFVLSSNTAGEIIKARWYNEDNVLRELFNISKTFGGLAPTGLLRWDLGVGMPDGTEQLLTSGNVANPTRPDLPPGAVVLYDILWNDETAIVSPGNGNGGGNTINNFGLKRLATRIQANSTGLYAKIWEGNLSNQNNYQMVLAYGGPASAGKQRSGTVNIEWKCGNSRNIEADTVKLETVDGSSTNGDFILVQRPGGRGAIYHRSHQFWNRLQWTIPFINSSINQNDFVENAPYEALPSGANWPSVKYTGGVDLSQYYKKEFIDSLDSTGTVILFDRPRTYGTRIAPLTASTYTEINPTAQAERKGLVQKLFVQGTSFNPPNTWYKLDDGVDYKSDRVNLITVEYFSATNKTYNIMHYV